MHPLGGGVGRLNDLVGHRGVRGHRHCQSRGGEVQRHGHGHGQRPGNCPPVKAIHARVLLVEIWRTSAPVALENNGTIANDTRTHRRIELRRSRKGLLVLELYSLGCNWEYT